APELGGVVAMPAAVAAVSPVASVPFVAAHRLTVLGAFLRAVLVSAVLVSVGGHAALGWVGLSPRVRHFSTLSPRPSGARACPARPGCDSTRRPGQPSGPVRSARGAREREHVFPGGGVALGAGGRTGEGPEGGGEFERSGERSAL